MNDKVVFITGSSQGIGKEIARVFVEKQYKVAINCVNSADKLSETLNEFTKINNNVISVIGDISEYETAKEIFKNIENSLGSVDILINNAGVSYIGLFNEMTPEQWQNIINNNLNSALNCTHLALPSMIHKKRGNIINISSMWGELGASCEVIYSSSKGAINSFTKSLAKELAPSNIRVNAVSCGAIDTRMNNFMTEEDRIAFTEDIPLMRFGKPEEVAELALFLATENSAYITGQIMNIDGGLT